MIKTEDLQDYAQYLLDEWNDIGTGKGRLNVQLEQFIRENKVKDLFYPNSAQETKLSFIKILKNENKRQRK